MSVFTMNPNQFSQSNLPGSLDLQSNPNPEVFTFRLNPATLATGGIGGGQPLKLIDLGALDAGTGLPICDVTASILDTLIGVAVTSSKQAEIPPGQPVQVAGAGAVVWMLSSGAVSRDTPVYADPANPGSVASVAAHTAQVFGVTLDKATAAGQLIRVRIVTNGTKYSGVSSS